MDNIGSTSPVRPAPPAPLLPSPPLFMSALSKLHGGATEAELQVVAPPSICNALLVSCSVLLVCDNRMQAREDKRRAFVEGLNSQVHHNRFPVLFFS